MSLELIRAKIKSKLESISGIGNVQDYSRHTVNWDEVETFFKKDGRLHLWEIGWASGSQEKTFSGCLALKRIHRFEIVGVYALKDAVASAKTFENLVEDVLDEFTKEEELISKVRWPEDEPPNLASIEERMFVGALCHRALINLVYEEQVSFT